MGLDIGPDRFTRVDPQPIQTIPDLVQTLALQSGVSAEALSALSPTEIAGMGHLEQMVAQHEQNGTLAPEALAGMIEARDQIRAEVGGRGAEPATQNAEQSLEAELEARGFETLQAPNDARLSIRGNQAVFDVNIHIFGSGATPAVARAFERQIQRDWGQNPATGQPWTYTSMPSGRTFEVRFDVDVDSVSTATPAQRQALIDRQRRPSDLDNYIEVVDPQRAQQLGAIGNHPHEDGFRPYLNRVGGDFGQWRGFDYGDRSMEDSASHEFGHLLGFRDRYKDQDVVENGIIVKRSFPDSGYEHNIMGAAGGRVTQTMIDNLMIGPTFERLRARGDVHDVPITGPLTE